MKYVALLGGINVGGQKSIKMNELAILFNALGFSDVKTYLQSGNVIFDAAAKGLNRSRIGEAIQNAIHKKYGFKVTIVLRTAEELAGIIKSNPFTKKKVLQKDKPHVTFFQEAPKIDIRLDTILPKNDGELYFINQTEVYLYCPNGYGKSKLNNPAIERRLKATTTTRNWKTVTELYKLAGGE
jgi:uncharacterized protein (DUF1697 family)